MTEVTHSTQSVGQKILKETTRFALLQVISSLLKAGANLLLARLLTRRDFGVFDICSFYIGIGSLLGDGGLGATLLRKKGDVTKHEYQVVLTALLTVGGVMGAALIVLGPWLGARNQLQPNETVVLQVMAPLFLLNALRVVPYIRLERDLAFGEIARIELVANTLRHAVAISVALFKGGVWAFVASSLVGPIVQLSLAYRASPGWVGLGFSWATFRPLIAFGSQVQALSVCAYLKDNLTRALLGPLMGPEPVGVFGFGLGYIQIPVVAVNALARVQLPVYARLESKDPALFSAVYGAVRTATLVGVPMLLALCVGMSWIVPVLYAPKWIVALPVIWGLLGNMVGGLSASPLFTLLQGQGRPALALFVFFLWTVFTWLLAIGSVVLFPRDLGAIAWCHSIATIAVVLWLLYWASKHLGRSLFPAIISPAIAMGVCLVVARGLVTLPKTTTIMTVVTHPLTVAVSCVVVYFAVLLTIDRKAVVREFGAVLHNLRPKKSGS